VLETADRKTDPPVNKPPLYELFDRPTALRERLTMLHVFLVIRVVPLRDEVAPQGVQHGQLVYCGARAIAKALDLVEGSLNAGNHLVCLVDRKSVMTHGIL
jgi:hypothetical protein